MTRQKLTINVSEWKKVATNIKACVIDVVEYFDINNYLIEIKNTGADAPINNGTATLLTERKTSISSLESIDIYIKALIKSGKVVITKDTNTKTTNSGSIKVSLEEFNDEFYTTPLPIVFVDSLNAEKRLKWNNESPQVCSQDYLQAVAEGDISGHSIFEKYGLASVQNSAVDLTGATNNPYVFPTGEQLRVVSSSTNDTLLGTGAQKILIMGLDSNYVEVSEEVSLNGNTPVPTVRTNWLRINYVNVSQVGTGGVAAGNIQVYHLTNATPIYGYISTGNNQSRHAIYTVPAEKTLYLTSIRISSGVGNTTAAAKANYITFTLKAKMDINHVLSTIFFPHFEIGMINNAMSFPLEEPIKIPSKVDFKMSVIGDTALAVTATCALRGWIE